MTVVGWPTISFMQVKFVDNLFGIHRIIICRYYSGHTKKQLTGSQLLVNKSPKNGATGTFKWSGNIPSSSKAAKAITFQTQQLMKETLIFYILIYKTKNLTFSKAVN